MLCIFSSWFAIIIYALSDGLFKGDKTFSFEQHYNSLCMIHG